MGSRKWCFTLNNYVPEEEDKLKNWFDQGKITYIVYGHEVGASGTPHLQGFVYFKAKQRMSALKKVIKRAHIEQAKGTIYDNYRYCTKDGQGVVEFGTKPQQGNRTDLASFKDAIKSGASDMDLADNFTNACCKFPKFIEFVRHAKLKEDNKAFKNVSVDVYWGDAGSGKTRKAYDDDPGLYRIDHASDRLWFNGYVGQKTVLLDDYYGGIKYSTLLHLLDGYPMDLQIKGGYTRKAWDRVIITSNKPPEEWYKQGMTPALKRRISKVMHFGTLPEWVTADKKV